MSECLSLFVSLCVCVSCIFVLYLLVVDGTSLNFGAARLVRCRLTAQIVLEDVQTIPSGCRELPIHTLNEHSADHSSGPSCLTGARVFLCGLVSIVMSSWGSIVNFYIYVLLVRHMHPGSHVAVTICHLGGMPESSPKLPRKFLDLPNTPCPALTETSLLPGRNQGPKSLGVCGGLLWRPSIKPSCIKAGFRSMQGLPIAPNDS